jgi:excisionase family DNA binding protein
MRALIDELENFAKRLLSIERIISELQRKQIKEPVKEWYNVSEAAKYLNVSIRTVRRLLARGLLKRNLAIRSIRIHRDDLTRYREL